MIYTGNEVRNLRRKAGMTQVEMARRLGRSTPVITRLEKEGVKDGDTFTAWALRGFFSKYAQY